MAPRVVRVCLVLPSTRNRPTETESRGVAVLWFLSAAFASAKHLRADFFVNHLGSHRSARRRNSTVTRHYDTPFSPPIEPPRRSLACENQHFTSTNSSIDLAASADAPVLRARSAAHFDAKNTTTREAPRGFASWARTPLPARGHRREFPRVRIAYRSLSCDGVAADGTPTGELPPALGGGAARRPGAALRPLARRSPMEIQPRESAHIPL